MAELELNQNGATNSSWHKGKWYQVHSLNERRNLGSEGRQVVCGPTIGDGTKPVGVNASRRASQLREGGGKKKSMTGPQKTGRSGPGEIRADPRPLEEQYRNRRAAVCHKELMYMAKKKGSKKGDVSG